MIDEKHVGVKWGPWPFPDYRPLTPKPKGEDEVRVKPPRKKPTNPRNRKEPRDEK